MKKQTSQR